MLRGVTFQQLSLAAAGAGALACIALLRAWTVWRRGGAPRPGLFRRCAKMLLEYPQGLGLLLLAGLGMPLAIAPVAYGAWALSSHPNGLLLFIPVALLGVGAALLLGGAASVASLFFIIRRLRGERPTLGMGLAAAARHWRGFLGWLSAFLVRHDQYNPFVLPALIADDAGLAAARARAEAFSAQAPSAAETVRPLHRSLVATVLGFLALFLPLAVGFFCLPALAFMGFVLTPLPGMELYAALWAMFGLALCLACFAAAFQLSCAGAHSACVYLYGRGDHAVRERVLRHLPLAWVWPEPLDQPAPEPSAPESYSDETAAPMPLSPALAQGAPQEAPLEEYAREAMLPQAGRAGPLGADAPPPVPLPTVVHPEHRPAPRRAPETESTTALAIYRLLVLIGVAALSLFLIMTFDGPGLAARRRLLARGVAAQATVSEIIVETKWATLHHRVFFAFAVKGNEIGGNACVGEGARGRLSRGDRVAIHYDSGMPMRAALDEDYGFTRKRTALLAALIGFLAVGAYSFLFRVL